MNHIWWSYDCEWKGIDEKGVFIARLLDTIPEGGQVFVVTDSKAHLAEPAACSGQSRAGKCTQNRTSTQLFSVCCDLMESYYLPMPSSITCVSFTIKLLPQILPPNQTDKKVILRNKFRFLTSLQAKQVQKGKPGQCNLVEIPRTHVRASSLSSRQSSASHSVSLCNDFR